MVRKLEPTKKITFKVMRKDPEMIAPAKPTPHEFKLLSDIDDQLGNRAQVPAIQFYRRNPSAKGKDPVKVIRDAIAKALVLYYPFAGRLRERAAKKLVVECTGEGVIFIEADADVTLQQLGHALLPTFPYIEDLLYDVPASNGILHCPLFLIQVTRLKCSSFIFAIRHNHTMSDAVGLVQFMTAVGEFARGAEAPSILPIWDRHLFSARSPPRVTCTHPTYDDVQNAKLTLFPHDDIVHHYFLFGAAEFSALRSYLPPHLQVCSRFELLTACIWRCRTIAISPEPTEEVRIMAAVNCRRRFNPPLPKGYYGNAAVPTVAIATANDLSKNPLHYALELVRKANAEVTEEYVKSTADLMVIRGRPCFTIVGTYVVSDLRHIGFEEVDYGWGKAAYGGPAVSDGVLPGIATFYIPYKNNEIVVPICLPAIAMEVFVKELEWMLKGGANDGAHRKIIPSAL